MKRAMICIVMLMTMVFCASAQDTTQVAVQDDAASQISVQKEAPGQFYFPFRVGYSLAPGTGINTGFGVGYKLKCGISIEGHAAVRQLTPSCCFATGIDASYEFPMCKKAYPVIGLGVGGLIIIPEQAAFFTADYHIGCNVKIVEDFVDLGVEYRGDLVSLAWVQHCLLLNLRFYIGNH